MSPFGVELRVFINDMMTPLFSSLVGSAGPGDLSPMFFDMALGQLSPGDVIYVAIGPNGSDQFDSVNLDFTIEKAVPEPGTLALFALGLAGLGVARRKRMI